MLSSFQLEAMQNWKIPNDGVTLLYFATCVPICQKKTLWGCPHQRFLVCHRNFGFYQGWMLVHFVNILKEGSALKFWVWEKKWTHCSNLYIKCDRFILDVPIHHFSCFLSLSSRELNCRSWIIGDCLSSIFSEHIKYIPTAYWLMN